MIKWKILVLAVFDLQFAFAMKAFHGSCPDNMTAVGDLDMERFKGKWYTHSIYPPLSLRIAKCQSTEFVEESDQRYSVIARELSSQTGTVKVRKADILKVKVESGGYLLDTKNTVFPEGVMIYILDTDYDNFAIRFFCFDSSDIFSFHWAVIQTRKRLPPPDILFMAQHFAHEAGLTLSDMSKVPQEACPQDT
ncbi:uncharacterized protein LOC108095171 [Drosophila ficusphila]|uniref:uncharacterized protein LOC108095171 n=1 Tax=Drosophila ficusphila TaxID=30025 RepID=UPI0007E7D5EC|nr:uncharacterized protein LOC108095171 [Drosophila ficusphila]